MIELKLWSMVDRCIQIRFLRKHSTHPLVNSLTVKYSVIELDGLFLVFQTTVSYCKRSEVRLGSSLFGFPTGHRSWSFAIFIAYQPVSQQIVSRKLDYLQTIVSVSGN